MFWVISGHVGGCARFQANQKVQFRENFLKFFCLRGNKSYLFLPKELSRLSCGANRKKTYSHWRLTLMEHSFGCKNQPQWAFFPSTLPACRMLQFTWPQWNYTACSPSLLHSVRLGWLYFFHFLVDSALLLHAIGEPRIHSNCSGVVFTKIKKLYFFFCWFDALQLSLCSSKHSMAGKNGIISRLRKFSFAALL